MLEAALHVAADVCNELLIMLELLWKCVRADSVEEAIKHKGSIAPACHVEFACGSDRSAELGTH